MPYYIRLNILVLTNSMATEPRGLGHKIPSHKLTWWWDTVKLLSIPMPNNYKKALITFKVSQCEKMVYDMLTFSLNLWIMPLKLLHTEMSVPHWPWGQRMEHRIYQTSNTKLQMLLPESFLQGQKQKTVPKIYQIY